MFIDTGYCFASDGVYSNSTDFWGALKTVQRTFLRSVSCCKPTHILSLVSVAIAALILLINKKRCDLLVILVGLCAVISLFYGFIDSEYLLFIKNISIFQGFQLGRFHFLHPLLWFVIFALALKIIYSIFDMENRLL